MDKERLQEESAGIENRVETAEINGVDDAGASKKGNKSSGIAKLIVILVIGLIVWLVFFRNAAPKNVTTEMLESGIVEAITTKEIIQQFEDANFAYYLGDVETVGVDVYMPNLVSQNPENQQTGDRYEVRDGYGYPVEMSLELYLTVNDTYGESYRSDPIDITVSGVIVYVTDAKTYAFRDIEIEYEEDFQNLLDLASLAALWQ